MRTMDRWTYYTYDENSQRLDVGGFKGIFSAINHVLYMRRIIPIGNHFTVERHEGDQTVVVYNSRSNTYSI